MNPADFPYFSIFNFLFPSRSGGCLITFSAHFPIIFFSFSKHSVGVFFFFYHVGVTLPYGAFHFTIRETSRGGARQLSKTSFSFGVSGKGFGEVK